ncbi:MAG TPA: metallopeptidase TldD-related protein [Acidimicrobiales bacterium]|nr:metallopeptidase TldD-related protein [Acidimicrobiales bacterium]
MSPGATRLTSPQEVVERALAASRGDGCVVIVEELSEAEVRFANNTTTTNGVRRDRRVAVVSFRSVGTAPLTLGVASASASGSGAIDVEALVRASEAEAAGAEPADDAVALVEPGPGAPAAQSPGFEDPPELTSPAVLDGVIGGLGEGFARARAAGNRLAGFATHGVATTYLGTSTGVRLRHAQPAGTMELVARSRDGARSVWAGAATSTFDDIDVAEFEARLDRRLGWARRSVELPAGRYQVLLPPDATADLMVALSQALSGRDAEEGRSPFSAPGGGTKVGAELCPLAFELRGDPAEPGLESSPFLVTAASGTDVSVFDNALAIGRTGWIEQGRLARLQYHRAAAARSGTDPAPPVGNLTLVLPGATASLDDMIATTERGLLLTCLWYIREVDPVTLLLTGLTRDGVYLVEHGEVVGAVNNFRFNESPIDVLARALEASGSERALSREWGEWMNRTAMPALRVADFNMSSVSPAT